MRQRLVHPVFLAVGVVSLSVTALCTSPAALAGDTAGGNTIMTTDGTLGASLERIARRSSLWRQALERLRGTDRHVFVVTPDQVAVKDSIDDASSDAFDPTVVAAVSPIPQSDSQVRTVVVVVNLPLIEGIHRRRSSTAVELHWDLDRILVHEIYGHALPYLLAGDLSGRCADPAPGQEASEACSIRRENAVRAELRLGRRTGYGLEDLFLARR